MKYGYYVPNFGDYGDPRTLADLAAEAESAGWDGFFIWDHLQWPDREPAVDPWIALSAIAMSTQHLTLGPMVTPLPRRDLAKLAREVLSLNTLSNNRLILGLGLGFPPIPKWSGFGHESDIKKRSAMLDEGLMVLRQLWDGQAVNFSGEYFQINCAAFAPTSKLTRVPIWLAATWPGTKTFQRAAAWDGVIPMRHDALEGGMLSPDELADIRAYVDAHQASDGSFDLVRLGASAGPQDTSIVSQCAAAGATWWLEMCDPFGATLEQSRARLRAGPARVAV